MAKGITAGVLAAGKSQRMGQLKQLLPFGDLTVIQTVLRSLEQAGIDDILVVLGHRADDIAAVLPPEVQVVRNAAYEEGMFSSVLAGLNALEPDVEGMMLVLVDQPQVDPGAYAAVASAYLATDKGIVIPRVSGKRGHPSVIDVARYGIEIRELDGSEGLKPLVRGKPYDTEWVDIADGSILRDMDTPEDYARELRLREEAEDG